MSSSVPPAPHTKVEHSYHDHSMAEPYTGTTDGPSQVKSGTVTNRTDQNLNFPVRYVLRVLLAASLPSLFVVCCLSMATKNARCVLVHFSPETRELFLTMPFAGRNEHQCIAA